MVLIYMLDNYILYVKISEVIFTSDVIHGVRMAKARAAVVFLAVLEY